MRTNSFLSCKLPKSVAELLTLSVHRNCLAAIRTIALLCLDMARKCHIDQTIALQRQRLIHRKQGQFQPGGNPNLSKILLRWCFTVSSLILKYSAISLLE